MAAFGPDMGSIDLGTSPEQRFYVFAIADGERPKVFSFPIDKDGMEAMANLLRSENVLEIVRGSAVEYSLASVVEVHDGGNRYSHAMPLRED